MVLHLERDKLIEVVIYKVGKVAAFQTRSIDLTPGVYTAVGGRKSYRAVRRIFRVAPEAVAQPIMIRCEDPI